MDLWICNYNSLYKNACTQQSVHIYKSKEFMKSEISQIEEKSFAKRISI